jgi:acetylornithine deacetylase/succinyl-diaminopimelate desuccinylase-like protein
LVAPLLGMTVSPTMITASAKRNVIPGVVEIAIDCRILPGQTPADAEAAIRAWLEPASNGDWDLVNVEQHGGTRSPLDGPLWDAVASFLAVVELPRLCASPASPIRIGCAMHSARSPTASSRRGWIQRSPRA